MSNETTNSETGTQEIVDRLRKHATDHYAEGGWDFLVECYGDDDLRKEVERYGLDTFEAARDHFANFLKVMDDRRADVQATADWA
jgi:hypothetical protein